MKSFLRQWLYIIHIYFCKCICNVWNIKCHPWNPVIAWCCFPGMLSSLYSEFVLQCVLRAVTERFAVPELLTYKKDKRVHVMRTHKSWILYNFPKSVMTHCYIFRLRLPPWNVIYSKTIGHNCTLITINCFGWYHSTTPALKWKPAYDDASIILHRRVRNIFLNISKFDNIIQIFSDLQIANTSQF